MGIHCLKQRLPVALNALSEAKSKTKNQPIDSETFLLNLFNPVHLFSSRSLQRMWTKLVALTLIRLKFSVGIFGKYSAPLVFSHVFG